MNKFDEVINRLNTKSLKWDARKRIFGTDDVLPMWVADMDFSAPEVVLEALRKRVNHGVFGYTVAGDAVVEATRRWLLDRHGWQTEALWHVASPGVVASLSLAVNVYTEPGEKVLIQTPVYPPFARVVTDNGRELVTNPLSVADDGRYEMDFSDLEAKLATGVKLVIFCNPHNPVGRVWTPDELKQFGDLCLEYDVVVVSDEIHADITYPGVNYTPLASVSDELAERVVTCGAPTKTFNFPGLHISFVIAKNEDLRRRFSDILRRYAVGDTNLLAAEALMAAYGSGQEWLDELREYLAGNRDAALAAFRERMPQIQVTQPEGTYLLWLDCTSLELDDEGLKAFFVNEAKVGVNMGHTFGEEGKGFVRLNLACPRSVLMEGLRRMEAALAAR